MVMLNWAQYMALATSAVNGAPDGVYGSSSTMAVKSLAGVHLNLFTCMIPDWLIIAGHFPSFPFSQQSKYTNCYGNDRRPLWYSRAEK
jgi:hypothetical protein